MLAHVVQLDQVAGEQRVLLIRRVEGGGEGGEFLIRQLHFERHAFGRACALEVGLAGPLLFDAGEHPFVVVGHFEPEAEGEGTGGGRVEGRGDGDVVRKTA